jgi:hypothetical protein
LKLAHLARGKVFRLRSAPGTIDDNGSKALAVYD